jgi:hypothetical protein
MLGSSARAPRRHVILLDNLKNFVLIAHILGNYLSVGTQVSLGWISVQLVIVIIIIICDVLHRPVWTLN